MGVDRFAKILYYIYVMSRNRLFHTDALKSMKMTEAVLR